MRSVTWVALAAGISLASSPALAATNLITNGSFETGDFTGWTYSGVTPSGAPAVIIPYNSNAGYPGGAYGEPIPPDNSATPSPDPVGDNAAYFVADGATESLSQTVHLLPGLYTIGFSVYVPLNGFNNAGNATFTGTIAGVNLANFTVDTSTPQVWVHYAGVANILTEGDYLSSFTFASAQGAAGDFVVDRAYIVAGNAIPEPSAWALMILGFGGVGGALRARRSLLAAA
ncbi:MAG: PEPxxWA-CTERM sorting domain-containing protein [Phenylobacterium sp.]|nr:PEPxxWA-CTERM sorting domain-containing protein [Phenylobacterium sp.]